MAKKEYSGSHISERMLPSEFAENCDLLFTAAPAQLLVKHLPEHLLEPVPTHSAIIRTDTHQLLGIVGSRYSIMQNSDMLTVLDSLGDQLTLYTVRDYGAHWSIGVKCREALVRDIPIVSSVVGINSFDGSHSASFVLTIVARHSDTDGTILMSSRSKEYKLKSRHTQAVQGLLETANAMVASLPQESERFEKFLFELGSLRMQQEAYEALIRALFPTSTRVDNIIDGIRPVAIGPMTCLRVYLAVCNYIDKGRRGAPAVGLWSSLFSSGAGVRDKLMELIPQYAERS